MFIQVIQAKVKDEAGLRAAMDRWQADLKPGATGYLGTTAGTTEDGKFVALARFESAEAAQANSNRPEQGEWWAEMEKNLDGPSFSDFTTVREFLDGGSDDAGFVQVMVGTSEDAARIHDIFESHSDALREGRPEIIGGLMLEADGGKWVDVIYFTSEKEAREGEAKEMPAEIGAEVEQAMALMGEVTYYDLRDPVLESGD